MSNNSSNTCIIINKSIASLNEGYKLIIRGEICMKKISLTILALVAVLMLASCGKAKKVSIAGSWGADSGSETVYLFNEDGTGKISIGTTVSKSFTYETNDNTLKIVTEILGQKDEQEYTYSIDGDVLTMTRNNESVTYRKQK